MNIIIRIALIVFSAFNFNLMATTAQAFQLGDPKFINGAGRFEIRIPVTGLERDATSKLTGTVYSRSEIVDQLHYRVENAGESLDFVARADLSVNESFTFVVEMSYRGMIAGRRYEFKSEDRRSETEQATSFSLTPGDVARFKPKARFTLDLAHTTHVVQTGQTLWDIAVDCEEIGGNNFQRSLAIFAANQRKFVNGDINLLSVDTTLVIPEQSYVDMFSSSDAASVFYKLATGALAIDATGGERGESAPAPSDTVLDNVEEGEFPSIEMASSREVPTEHVMLARRIDSLETRVQSLLSENRSLMQAWRSELEQRIEQLESSQP